MNDRAATNPLRSGLFTDLYELTMVQAYVAERMDQTAVFELFFRELPDDRNYVVAAGLNDTLDFLEHLHFTDDDLAYLAEQDQFNESFLEYLAGMRFTGEVNAVREGTVVFPDEPLIQVVAPIAEAQIAETAILNQVHFQTVAATKAARVVHAAGGRTVVDFGSRRAHGSDAAIKAARASFLAGAAGTSNVLAGRLYDIPIFGTMAHSYIQAHDDELDAFEAFARQYPHTTLLVDTYDTIDGVSKVIRLRNRLGDAFDVRAVRLDSGDLLTLSRHTRRLLDQAGLTDINILVSGGIDEHKIEKLLGEGAPIDGFGVGTKLVVVPDAPDLDMAYKLVEYAGRSRMKLSSEKEIFPGRKQIFRSIENDRMTGDVLARFDETRRGQPSLEPVMRNGRRLDTAAATLDEAREHCRRQIEMLPNAIRRLHRAPEPYPVEISDQLRADRDDLEDDLEATQPA
jgi:nicotinate phosphoribosyltransferase